MIKKDRLAESQGIRNLRQRHPDLRMIDDPQKVEYYRHDLNVDLPPMIRDFFLESRADLVVQPTREEHILDLFSIARQEKIPLTVRGAGTTGYGGAVPTQGGILIDLGLMNQLEVNREERTLTVQAGVRFYDIERELSKHGLALLSMPSGKGGTMVGWIATGGMGFGTLRHGPVRRQLLSLRVISPDGCIRELKAEDPDSGFYVSTEGQMGVIVKATVRVGLKPAKWFPFVIPFERIDEAYRFVQGTFADGRFKPEDCVVYNAELISALRSQSDGKIPVGQKNMVLAVFEDERDARSFEGYLQGKRLKTGDPGVAQYLWDERFLPMSIKPLGPSLLAAQVILPLAEISAYRERIEDWGKRLGLKFYATSHLISPREVLFLALMTSDARKVIYYAHLLLVPMLTRLAVERFHGKPYELGIWNTPFLKDLMARETLQKLIRYKRKVDPLGILNPGKFFEPSGRLGRMQKILFQKKVFDLELSFAQWVLFRLFSVLPERILRRRITVESEGLEAITHDILSCAQCGVCVARCPVYRATGDETFAAKGKLLTIRRAFRRKKLELAKVLPLYFCLHCSRCDQECQVHLKHRPLFEELEKYLSQFLPFPLKEVARFIAEVEESPEFQKFLEVIRTGFDQKIREKRQTFPRYQVKIDEEYCYHCGTCIDACMYSVRRRDEADPRRVLIEDEALCRGCGSCLERCPQVAQGMPATTVELHPDLLQMADPYWTDKVITHIDLEATTGKIPVSGTGQGDPHRGFGNDGIRFGHFHIVGPAQNLLYESSSDAVAIQLGRRPKYLSFEQGRIVTPAPRLIGLRTPILMDILPLEGGAILKEAMVRAAETMGTRVAMRLSDWDHYGTLLEGRARSLMLRLTTEDVSRLAVQKEWPYALKKDLPDLVEIELDSNLERVFEKASAIFPADTVFCAVLKIQSADINAELRPNADLEERLEALIRSPFDILCFTSDYDPQKQYYPTTDAIPAVHRFLVDRKIRHRFSILAAGGIRSAADTQKTIQRGANGVKIDWPILLTVDPMARQKFLRGERIQPVGDLPLMVQRITNLIRVWNVQIIEVLGASGFKDIKKTVGEENRLLIFDDLEERIYDLFHSAELRERNQRVNQRRIEREGEGKGWRYRELKELVKPTALPHCFYQVGLKPSCYQIFDRDHVWPASLIAAVGRMASGDPKTLLLKNVEECGNLGDGFDAVRIRFQEDPDQIPDDRLDQVSTSLQLTADLKLKGPFMGAGMSVGSIGPGTWRARVLATKVMGTQVDTGEGGYPTSYILDEKWNPLDFSEGQVMFLRSFMEERKLISVQDLLRRIPQNPKDSPEGRAVLEALRKALPSMTLQYVPIVTPEDQDFVSTQLKTGLFGVTKETIRRARRVVIAYSQGAKQGVGGHLLGRKVFGLVSLLRGVGEGISLISPFPFHNCYSIEDVKAFIDAVRMINRRTAVSIKVSPSPDIEFICAGLARIAKDNQMTIEVWLDGPRGGTGAAPDIIKGQMGMHLEYAIPICHEKLMGDGLRDYVVFMGSGGFRTWGDILKGVALGLDGVILGTADLVAIGCVRDRNCESGCRSGISTIEPRMQLLRNVEVNTQQVINFRALLQAQLIRALAGLGLRDIRELRGRYDLIEWTVMEDRVRERRRRRAEVASGAGPAGRASRQPAAQTPEKIAGGPTPADSPADCGVAAIVSNHFIPSYIMDLMLDRMANRGMDGVGIWKGGCYPDHLDHYAINVLVKGTLQPQVEREIQAKDPDLTTKEIQRRARDKILAERRRLMQEIFNRYLKGLEIEGFDGSFEKHRLSYRRDAEGEEQDFRNFGEKDPGDVFRFFVRVQEKELERFITEELLNDPVWAPREMRYREITAENFRLNLQFRQEAEDEYIYRLARRITQENYTEVEEKKAAVMSCGKNSGCWKTDGQQIPWELPEAPVNVIHRRLATGSVVDQMNAHPFAELHTALTHNGETTNYRTMLNRVAQFNLTPLAQTDTAVASLKLHLLSQYLKYPFDALVEAFSPTTGWKLTQLPPEVRQRLERVQEVELESAPDGPYQYLCGRIDPYQRVIERLDIIDPSLLRPNVAMLYNDGENFVDIICSEKQGCDAGIEELHRLGLIRSAVAPMTFTVTTGLLSRVFYDAHGRITGHEVLDKFGQPISIPRGSFPALEEERSSRRPPFRFEWGPDLTVFFRERLPRWSFSEFQSALRQLAQDFPPCRAVIEMTRIYDHLAGWETQGKDRGALSYLLREHIHQILDGLSGNGDLRRITFDTAADLQAPQRPGQVLVVDARGFRPEGIDPQAVLSCFLDQAHRMGWRKFILYRAQGQRGIGMGMGAGFTGDTTIDVFGSPGEYCGAFNMGVYLRVHSHAQNFTGMVMHSGILEIHGDAGKVAGYSAKGGTFYILGNVIDRGWVCAVSDPRGPGLEVNIVGTGYEHLGQALMGGSILMLGLYRDYEGKLNRRPSPYSGNKILAGASAGEVIFYDPFHRLEGGQYEGCTVQPIDDKKWADLLVRLARLEEIFALGFSRVGDHLTAHLDGAIRTITPEDFRWILPTGALEGYH